MDRLTIPDEPIEGGTRRAVVDARAVKEQALTLYWALKKYEDTGLTPEEIMEGRMRTGWIPVEEWLPEELETALVTNISGTIYLTEYEWEYGFDGNDDVIAWMPLPEPYNRQQLMPEKEDKMERFPYVIGERAEIFHNGEWKKGKIINGYRFQDGIVTIRTEDGETVWCGEARKDLYRPIY